MLLRPWQVMQTVVEMIISFLFLSLAWSDSLYEMCSFAMECEAPGFHGNGPVKHTGIQHNRLAFSSQFAGLCVWDVCDGSAGWLTLLMELSRDPSVPLLLLGYHPASLSDSWLWG